MGRRNVLYWTSLEQKASEGYEPYLHIFWKCVRKNESISICQTSTKIDLSEGNIIKGAGLPIDIYLTLLEESIHWQELWGKKMYPISNYKKRQPIQSQGVFLDWTFVVPQFSQLAKCCFFFFFSSIELFKLSKGKLFILVLNLDVIVKLSHYEFAKVTSIFQWCECI